MTRRSNTMGAGWARSLRVGTGARAACLFAAAVAMTACCGDEPQREDFPNNWAFFAAHRTWEDCDELNTLLFSRDRPFDGVEAKASRSMTRPSEGDAAKAAVVMDRKALTFRAAPDVPAPNHANLVVPYELVPPFRVECVTGLCDPAFYPAPTSVFGLSIVERTGAERQFSADCSRVGGITATASFGTPVPHAFAGAERVDLALEHDGTDLVAFARDHKSGGAWIEVSRTALAGVGSFLPKIGASDFEPGQMVTFFSLRVQANAPFAPGQATPQQQAVRAMAEAIGALADGADQLMASDLDVAAATLRIQVAGQHVQDAVVALDAAAGPAKKDPNVRKRKKARKAALKAAKSVTQAISSLDPTGAGETEKVFRRLGTAAISLAQAADAILPDDLRAEIGGLTLKSFLRK